MKKIDLSLVIPVFNEQENLHELINRCTLVCESLGRSYEIVLVDDGSRDESSRMLRASSSEPGSHVVSVILNRNYGQHPAVMAGFAHARGDVVVTLDADLQNPPEEIPKLLARIDQGCDVVGSYRINRRDSWLRRLPSRIINFLVRKTTGFGMSDYGCMLRAYRRSVVDAILICPERSTFIPILANGFASKTADVPVKHSSRSAGKSKYGFWSLINLQFDLLTSMTSFPLRLLSVIGGLMAACGFCIGLTLIVLRMMYGSAWAVDGVFTVVAALFLFAGVQLFGLGLLGEYLSRVYNDVRGRPRYFVHEVLTPAGAGQDGDQRVVTLKSMHERSV